MKQTLQRVLFSALALALFSDTLAGEWQFASVSIGSYSSPVGGTVNVGAIGDEPTWVEQILWVNDAVNNGGSDDKNCTSNGAAVTYTYRWVSDGGDSPTTGYLYATFDIWAWVSTTGYIYGNTPAVGGYSLSAYATNSQPGKAITPFSWSEAGQQTYNQEWLGESSSSYQDLGTLSFEGFVSQVGSYYYFVVTPYENTLVTDTTVASGDTSAYCEIITDNRTTLEPYSIASGTQGTFTTGDPLAGEGG